LPGWTSPSPFFLLLVLAVFEVGIVNAAGSARVSLSSPLSEQSYYTVVGDEVEGIAGYLVEDAKTADDNCQVDFEGGVFAAPSHCEEAGARRLAFGAKPDAEPDEECLAEPAPSALPVEVKGLTAGSPSTVLPSRQSWLTAGSPSAVLPFCSATLPPRSPLAGQPLWSPASIHIVSASQCPALEIDLDAICRYPEFSMGIFDGDDDHEGGNCVWPSQCEGAGRKRLASGPMPVAVP
jgi:hypothetical protein